MQEISRRGMVFGYLPRSGYQGEEPQCIQEFVKVLKSRNVKVEMCSMVNKTVRVCKCLTREATMHQGIHYENKRV